MQKSKFQNKSLFSSFKYAIQGIISAIKSERNLRIDFLVMFIVLGLGILFKISVLEWIICIVLFSLVISAEIINTVIEIVVDMITLEKNPQAKLAKDLAAASVLIIAIAAAIVGIVIFLPKIVNLF